MPGLEVLFQVGGVQEANDCFSPSLSPSLPLSLKIKINKIFKKKRERNSRAAALLGDES